MNKTTNENCELKFKEITNKLLIGVDIGGSLLKICILINKDEKIINDYIISKKNFELNDIDSYNLFLTTLQTIDFEKEFLPILRDLNDIVKINEIYATGGGAFKFNSILKKNLNLEFKKYDELKSLILGYVFMNKYNSFYELDNGIMKKIPPSDLLFPHVSANIGSGVSILKVESPKKFERVGGTLMGGGTLIGMAKLTIGMDDYNEILELASKGNCENVDITMNDMNCSKSKESNTGENLSISSLGKIHELVQSGKKDEIKKEDIALSLLNLICSHIAQYSVLYAEKDKIDTIYYFGTFTKNNLMADFALTKASKQWNKNIKVRFNYYGGYLGAIGTLLDEQN